MVQKREAYAPWSLTRKAGVQSATVNGDIEVPQFIQPVLDTGFVDEDGNWKGTKSSDEQFTIDETHEAVANTGVILSPQAGGFDMTGFEDLFIAIKPSSAGNCLIHAVMGLGDTPFSNLSPVEAATSLRGLGQGGALGSNADFDDILSDGAESLAADVWNIFVIQGRLKGQKNLQIKIQNNSGSESDIQFAYLRVV